MIDYIVLIISLCVALYSLLFVFRAKSKIKFYKAEMDTFLLKLHLPIEKLQGEAPSVRLLIEVLEPLKLAKERSVLAKMFVDTAPHLITKKVYEQVAEKVRIELKRNHVSGQVDIVLI